MNHRTRERIKAYILITLLMLGFLLLALYDNANAQASTPEPNELITFIARNDIGSLVIACVWIWVLATAVFVLYYSRGKEGE